MKLKITAYDKDNKMLFSKGDFDGESFYEKIFCKISDILGFTWMSNTLADPQKRRVLMDRRIGTDTRFVLNMAMQDRTVLSGNAYINDAISRLSGLEYGNLPDINEYFYSNRGLCRKAERLILEKI